MPLREFTCPYHGTFEKFCGTATHAECPNPIMVTHYGRTYEMPCGQVSPVVEFSVPAKRNPRHGEG
jgi:hypothetical protein